MKNVFTIGKSGAACNMLLLEIGADYCCYALLKGEERSFQQISYFSYEQLEASEAITALMDELENQHCEKVVISSAFAECLLVPQQYAHSATSLLKQVYDDHGSKAFYDAVPEWQITAVYHMPESLVHVLETKFSSAQFLHAYTPLLKMHNGAAPDHISVHFSTGVFRVFVRKNSQAQLAQTYAYKTPLDVVYFLLKICYEFQLQQSEVVVVLSGLIDKDSALYKELYNYFLNIDFAQAPAYSVPDNEHPHHYFTSLYNLASCAL